MKQNLAPILWLALGGLLSLTSPAAPAPPAASAPRDPTPAIVAAGDAFAEQLAAREVRRYTYVRTGRRLPIATRAAASAGPERLVVVARKDRAWLHELSLDAELHRQIAALGPEEYWLKTVTAKGRALALLVGGDDAGVLYAAYRFAERLGVRFYLHGDVVPDAPLAWRWPVLDERAAPLFRLRGLQPFHDFPEGPDWWNEADYKAILSQLPKLRMNFFALHTYPEDRPNAEPTVWIGPPGDFHPDGRVRASYPSSTMNTRRGNWGYAAKSIADYVFGAADLFAGDAHGAELMGGHLPHPTAPADCNAVFDRTGDLLRAAFTHARQLGIKTCVGTETPLIVPKQVAERLRATGRDPADPKVIQELYAGIFGRIGATHPLDYYWFWTPEGWTWEGTKDEQVRATTNDLFAALAAHRQVQAPFALATCGWVLGPQQDRALFDKVLPKSLALSCINREVGRTPVDPAFAKVQGRSKWAIPWLEDDPALTSPQLWVGRMRRDAADAHRYGCDGLMGIHWRTRTLAPAMLALARAAWAQDWPPPEPAPAAPRTDGPEGGTTAAFPHNVIADTPEPVVYQTVRYNFAAYRLAVSNGTYRVTLKFCEPHHRDAGKRVFDVALQGHRVLENLDIFARVGADRALDFHYDRVAVTNGWLELAFTPVIEFPSLAGLVVEGPGLTRKINCGGPAWQDYAADESVAPAAKPRFPPTLDFYLDWAAAEFGPAVRDPAARLFADLDGHLPRPSDWVDGPGGIRPDPRPWREVQLEYAFVDEFAALRAQVRGPGHRDRFDYWLHTFQYLRAMGQVNCLWAEYNRIAERLRTEPDAARRQSLARTEALPARRALVAAVADLWQNLLAHVSNPGELGTVMNWEQHNLPGLLTIPGAQLAAWLGEPLPPDALPRTTYRGPNRLFVPTVRTSLARSDRFELQAIVLAERAPAEVVFRWRNLGDSQAPYTDHALAPRGRGVYALPPGVRAPEDDFEYHVVARFAEGPAVLWPATAPRRDQTVLVTAF